MLKNILKHETQNGECLKELVQRIQKIEESSKALGRKEDFTKVHNMRDYMHSPPQVYSPQAHQPHHIGNEEADDTVNATTVTLISQ